MKDSFAPSLDRLAEHEGGFVDHPRDPGGATMRGITQRVYDGYRKARNLRTVDVRRISDEEVATIYRQNYWDAAKCDILPRGIDFLVFDGAVNSGPGQSVKWLQRALNALGADPQLKIDGGVGNATIGAVRALGGHGLLDLVDHICDRRILFLKQLRDKRGRSQWTVFGGGWSRRVEQNRSIAKAWIMADRPEQTGLPADAPADQVASMVPLPDFVRGAAASATIDMAVRRPTKAVADALTGAGVGTATISQTINAAVDQLNPIPSMQTVVAWLTVAGVVVALAGIALRWYQKKRESKRADALDLPTRRGTVHEDDPA